MADKSTVDKGTVLAFVERALIAIGVIVSTVLARAQVFGDGRHRFRAVESLFRTGRMTTTKYSAIMPLLATPLYLLGDLWGAPRSACAQLNKVIFLVALLVAHRLLRRELDAPTTRRFLLLLMVASMFPFHLGAFYGEVFSSLALGLGVMAVCVGATRSGWIAAALGTANAPATAVGAVFVTIGRVCQTRRLRHFAGLAAAAVLIIIEMYLRQGAWGTSGYEGDAGFRTVMPYSGQAGFSHPIFFGVLGIMLSFGKGLLFFAPGLFVGAAQPMMGARVSQTLTLWRWYVAGLVIVYAGWWSWYGGEFWGPRFFLFASLPACLGLATRLSSDDGSSARADLVTLVAVLLSLWVGASGAAFRQTGLGICSASRYRLEHLCWYVPEFSALWRPFVVTPRIEWRELLILVYHAVAGCVLVVPPAARLKRHGTQKLVGAITWMNRRRWRL